MVKRLDIKSAFGGEVAFTKFIASDPETSKRLLASLDLSYEDGYAVTPEEHTSHSKRVDLVIRDSDSEITLVVESQDASGWLDSIHASKITYYMYDKQCDDGVLICEDADEHIKGYIKYLNENTPLRITLVGVVIFGTEANPHCEFIPLIRPSQLQDKKVRRVGPSDNPNSKADVVQQIAAAYPGEFTNVTSRYVSRNNIAGTGWSAGIHCYNSGGFFVEIWHAGKANTETFRSTFTEMCKEHGWEPKFQQRRAYTNGENCNTIEGAHEVFRTYVKALEDKQIYSDPV
jgi:hypothetical protein